MVERWIGSTTRRRGVYGGEFLLQGFAYQQSGGREEGSKAARAWRKVCGGEGAASPCPSSKPISSLNNLNSPLSRNPISSLNDLNSPLSRNSIPRFKRVKSL